MQLHGGMIRCLNDNRAWLLLCPSSSIGDDLRYSGSPTRSPPSRARLIAVLRYIDPCLGLPCRARRPLPAKRRPKFISVAAWGARLRECSTPSIGFNLCENCYKFLSESNAAHRQSLQIGTATTDRDGKCHPPSVPIRAHPWFMSTRRYRLPPRPSVPIRAHPWFMSTRRYRLPPPAIRAHLRFMSTQRRRRLCSRYALRRPNPHIQAHSVGDRRAAAAAPDRRLWLRA